MFDVSRRINYINIDDNNLKLKKNNKVNKNDASKSTT